ncbi:MAG: acyloxyacyl hydrolase [Lentimicrobiaceae bacterium]|nr:acyloxyacyl hydrolase [Lentimicrobiaceae bacterium]
MKRFVFVLLFSLFLFLPDSFSQIGMPSTKHNFQLEARMHYGFFFQHHFEMKRFSAHFPAYEISLFRATYGKNNWETVYRYPLMGVAVYYSDLGGFEEIGSVYAVYPFVNLSLFGKTKNQLSFRFGLGIGYLTNHFDAKTNYRNFAIGSHINAAASIYFDYRRAVTKRLTFFVSGGLTHFSNGSTKTPNNGINIISVSGGASYFLRNPNRYLEKKILPELYKFEFDGKQWFAIECSFLYGYKDMTQEYGTAHPVYNLAIDVSKQVSMVGKLGIGFDLVLDYSDETVLKYRYDTFIKKDIELLKPGVNVLYEMLLGRVSFLFNVGFHVWRDDLDLSEGIFYQKLNVKYLITNKLFLKVGLTTHLARADYIGYGLGYRFDIKYYKSWKNRRK